jgi:iron complex transport system substrate-binding protein
MAMTVHNLAKGRRVADFEHRVAMAVAILAVTAIVGCGSHQARPQASVSSGDGFPVTIADAQGVEVTVASRPTRILSTSPAVTEILFALGAGDRVVAVTDHCNYPPQAARLPKIGGFWTPSVERALGARPDLVIGSRGNPPDFVAALRKSGLPVMTVDPHTLRDIYDTITRVANLIGAGESGERLIASMQSRLKAVSERIGDVPEKERPTAFLVLQVMPPWTAGAGTFQDDAIRSAGAVNIASDLKGFAAYSTETLVARDPGYLLLSTMDGDRGRMKTEVMGNPVLRQLSAVKRGRMLVLDSDPLMRAGPRIVDAVEAMARGFYPSRFATTPAQRD